MVGELIIEESGRKSELKSAIEEVWGAAIQEGNQKIGST